MKVLKVRDLSVQFHDGQANQEALQSLSFDIFKGEIVGLMGESGSGKSTAMEAIMGLLSGQAQVDCRGIWLEGENITPYEDQKGRLDRQVKKAYERKMEGLRGSQIGMVFQEPLTYLNPTVKIGRQIMETIRAHEKGCTRVKVRARALELLDMVGIRNPKERLEQYPFELSGGIGQRVALAIAVACRPKLLLADEPTTALDATVQGQILQLLARIAKETKTAILLASHDLGVIGSLCSRVLVLHKGKLVEEGETEEVFRDPKQGYTKQLMEDADSLCKLTRQKSKGVELLSFGCVKKSYRGQGWGVKKSALEAVQEVSFTVHKGETFGLVGESGGGKTTVARMAAGILHPSGGEIAYQGTPMKGVKRQIQMVFQDPYASLNPRMTVEEALGEPMLLHFQVSPEVRRQKVAHMLELVGLSPEVTAKYPRAFSGGERQRLCIARALLAEPELLVWDEPVSALDVSIQRQIVNLLERIQKERDISCLFISHDLNVVKRVSQRLGVMYEGSLMEVGETRDIYEQPWHPYTKMLLSSILVPNLKAARKRRLLATTQEFISQTVYNQGCVFVTRCGYAMECCQVARPQMYSFGSRQVACYLYSREHTGRRRGNYKMTCQI